MEWLRWILLAVGAILIGAIYLAGRRQQRPPSDSAAASSFAAESPSGDAPAVSRGDRRPTAHEPALADSDLKLPDFEADAPANWDDLDELYVEPFSVGDPDPSGDAEAPLGTAEDASGETHRPEAGGSVSPEPVREKAAETAPEASIEPPAAVYEPAARPGSDAHEIPASAENSASGENPASGAAPAEPAASAPAEPSAPEAPAAEKFVVLYVAAAEGRRLVGAQLAQAFARQGLEHGELGAFHARARDGSTDARGRPATEFSVANVVEPGSFDPATMDTLSTPGIVLVLRVPGPPAPLAAFERMVVTARDLARELDGRVLDEKRTPLTRQSEQLLRDELRRQAAAPERNG